TASVDTIWRILGIDSIYFQINGVQYAILDSVVYCDTTSLSNRIDKKINYSDTLTSVDTYTKRDSAISANGLNYWNITGNSGTSSWGNFIGTTDATPLHFRINNSMAGKLDINETHFGYNAGIGSTGEGCVLYGTYAGGGNTSNSITAIGYQSCEENVGSGIT